MQQVLDVAQRQRKTDVQHYRKADDFWRRFETADQIGLAAKLWSQPLGLKSVSSDSTVPAPRGSHRVERRVKERML